MNSNTVISMPSQLFTMRSSFKAVANGSVYIGEVDTDPTIPTNQIQVYIEQENGTLVPVDQPIKINSAGLLTASGQVQKFVLTNTEYSMTVQNSYGVDEFYFPRVYDQGISAALEVERRATGVGVEYYYGRNGKYVQDGDIVPVGTTHLIVLIDGKAEEVAISPIASGAVSLLAETSATIGGVEVKFLPASVRMFNSVSDMLSIIDSLPVGGKYSTGATIWKRISSSNGDISDFEALNALHTSDFINDSESSSDGDAFISLLYSYFDIQSYYVDANAVDSWRFSHKYRHIHFNKKVTASQPLPFIQACRYTSSRGINNFSRSIDTVDFMYTPVDLMTEAVKPLLYIKQPDGSYTLNTSALKGTPDNEFNVGDSDYITGSSNVDFNIYVGTSPGVRVGLNSTGTTHSKGTFGIGVQEDGTDNVSAPQVGWYMSKAWASNYTKPYVFGRIQSLVVDGAIAGTEVHSAYHSRNGINSADTDAVYTNAELSGSGKHKTSGITILSGSDYHFSCPIIEHFKCPIVVSGFRSEVLITKPHIEAYGGVIDHSILINGDAKIDINNWEHLYATGGAEVIFTIGAVSGTRVYLRGSPMQLGPINGLINGDSSQPVLYIDHISESVSDYGAIGNIDLILGVQNPLLNRTIFVDGVNGDDKWFGTRSASPIKTMEEAVKRVNLLFDKLDITPFITIVNDVSLLANSLLKTPVSIDIQSGSALNSNGFYILLDSDISLTGSGSISGVGAAFRNGPKSCNIHVNGPTISTYSIVTSVNTSQVNVSQQSGNTSGITKYVDGGGQSPVIISVNGGTRNSGIDGTPVSGDHFTIGTKFTS